MTIADKSAESYRNVHRTLLAVSEAIISHRDLAALMNELADRLHQVVRFDYLALVLYDPANDPLNTHVLAPPEPILSSSSQGVSVDNAPAGLVWKTQKPLIVPNIAEETRWPDFAARAGKYGILSASHLPLTTARRRLGALVFACKQPVAYREE